MPKRRPPCPPGELDLTQAAAIAPVGIERLRQLAASGELPSRSLPMGDGTCTYCFSKAQISEYFERRPARKRRARPAPTGSENAAPTDEVAYLRGVIAEQEARRVAMQDELTKAKVAWATSEARIDELRRKCAEQSQIIQRLTATIAESSGLDQDLGN